MKRLGVLLVTGLILFLLFVFFSFLVHKNLFTQFDFDTTVRFQNAIPHKFDRPFSWLSELGSFEPVLLFLLIVLLIRRKLSGFFALMLFAAFHVFELFGKAFVSHLPPPQFMVRAENIFNFPQFHVREVNSYPSGHAGRAAFVTVFLSILIYTSPRLQQYQKWMIIGLFVLYDMVMFASRIYLGEHWSSDVIGGAILGAGLGILSIFLADFTVYILGTLFRIKSKWI